MAKDDNENLEDYSIKEINESLMDEEEDYDYDEEYMTNVSNNLVEEVNKVLNQNNEKQTKKEKIEKEKEKKYLSFENRLFKNIVLFSIFFVCFLTLLFVFLRSTFLKKVKYTETSDIDYKVILLENETYDESEMSKDFTYVGNLIDKVKIDFKYNIESERDIEVFIKYNFYGTLMIFSNNNEKLYEKQISLISKEVNSLSFEEPIEIDYSEYKKVLSAFKKEAKTDVYGILDIYYGEEGSFDKVHTSSNNSKIVSIPITLKDELVKIDYNNILVTNSYVIDENYSVLMLFCLIISIVSFIISMYFLYKTLYYVSLLRTPKSLYDKFIKNTLKKYDKSIVIHHTMFDYDKYNIIIMKEFKELLDLHNNTKAPIMFYNVIPHQKSHFFIIINKDLYLYKAKSVDFDK